MGCPPRTTQFCAILTDEGKVSRVIKTGQPNFGLSKPLIILIIRRLNNYKNSYQPNLWRDGNQSKIGLISTGASLRPLPLHKMNKSEPVTHRNNR